MTSMWMCSPNLLNIPHPHVNVCPFSRTLTKTGLKKGEIVYRRRTMSCENTITIYKMEGEKGAARIHKNPVVPI